MLPRIHKSLLRLSLRAQQQSQPTLNKSPNKHSTTINNARNPRKNKQLQKLKTQGNIKQSRTNIKKT